MPPIRYGTLDALIVGFYTAAALLVGVLGVDRALAVSTAAGFVFRVIAWVAFIAVLGRIAPVREFHAVRGFGLFVLLGFSHDLLGFAPRALGMPLRHGDLMAIDEALFGGHVSLATQGMLHPWVAEIMQVCYALFPWFTMPLMNRLTVAGRYREVERYYACLFGSSIIVFIGYMLVPAYTPDSMFRFLGAASPIRFDAPIPGVFMGPVLREWLFHATSNQTDAFPSGHTTVVLTAVIAAAVYDRRVLAWLGVPWAMILGATVFMRYHFVIDVVCGAVVAVGFWLASPALMRAVVGDAPDGLRSWGDAPAAAPATARIGGTAADAR